MGSIDKTSRMPLYFQLVELIMKDIEEGKYLENEKIPSERELCDIYQLSRVTVRQAIAELEKMNILHKEHGRGTFVSPKMSQTLQKFYSFTDEMIKLGKSPSSKVLSFDIVKANKKVARKLNCAIDTKVFEIIRLRYADDDAMMYERTYLPYHRFEGLSKSAIENYPMYDVFRTEYDVIFSKAEETLKPVTTRDYEADLLNTNPAIPSMKIERITFEDDAIIEYTISIARGDQFEYRVVLD